VLYGINTKKNICFVVEDSPRGPASRKLNARNIETGTGGRRRTVD
jgi:hypothetical protein